jgi:hypothetical protein
MGATGWQYFTPYQENIEKALKELQQKVFESGKYGLASQFPPDLLNQIPQLKASYENLKKIDEEMLKNFGPIKSIDDLREAFAEAGTHTIIDIERISAEPDIGIAYPVPQEVIQKVYGTTKPSHQEVESKHGDLSEAVNIERFQAVYLIIYENDIPKEIYFEGCSGD